MPSPRPLGTAGRLFRLVRLGTSLLSRTAFLWLTAPFVRKRDRSLYRATSQMRACRKFCRILGLDVSLVGNVPPGGALVVSNHLGAFDPAILASQIPVAFVAKAELARAPVVGWICRTVGIIFVERERRMQAGSFAEDVRARIDAGIRVLVFPEGTTSNGHSIQPFKTGAFAAIAGESSYQVLPLCMNVNEVDGEPATLTAAERLTWTDSNVSYASHGWSVLGLRRVRIIVAVGEPIDSGSRDRKQLATEARDRMLALKTPAAGQVERTGTHG